MRSFPALLVLSCLAVALPGSTHAVEILGQTAEASIRVDGLVYADGLSSDLPGSLVLEQGSATGPGDYAYAELFSLFSPGVIDLSVAADVGRAGHEGQSIADITLVFVTGRKLEYTLLRGAHAQGEGGLDHAAFVILEDQNGPIWSTGASAGDVCHDDRPDWQELCFGSSLPPGTYMLTLHAEAYVPAWCGACVGYALDARSAVRLEFLVPPEALDLDVDQKPHKEVEVVALGLRSLPE